MLLSVAATWPQVLSKSGQFWLNIVYSLLFCGHAARNSNGVAFGSFQLFKLS